MVTRTHTPLPTQRGASIQLAEIDINDLYDRSWGNDLASFLGDRLGRPGMLWRGGRYNGETHPELRVAGGGKPSRYWDIRNDPVVRGMLRKAALNIGAQPFRLVPADLPAWLEGNAEAERARDLQHAYAERILWRWKQQGARGWMKLVRNILNTVPVEGFAWFEIVADTRTLSIPDLGEHTVLWPDSPPEWRAPWSIRYWIMEDEKPLGVVANFSQSSDWDGGTGDSWCVIPAEKILHIATEQVGSNLYGESWLRPIYEMVKAKRQLNTVEMVSKTINGVGELFFKIAEGVTLSADDQGTLKSYLKGRTAAAAGGMILPNGVDVVRLDGELIDHSALAKRLDQQISVALNQDDRLMALQETGAMSARETASSDASDVFDAFCGELIAEPVGDMFSRMISHSWPEYESIGWIFTPRLVWHDEGETDVAAHITNLSTAVDSGLLTWTEADEATLREQLGVGVREVAEEIDADASTITPDALQPLRLAYSSGILHDPDLGNAIRRQYGLPDVTTESIAAYKDLTGKSDTSATKPTPNDEDAAE